MYYVCRSDPAATPGSLYLARRRRRPSATHLIPLRDVATPNLFELDWLAAEPSDLAGAFGAARLLGARRGARDVRPGARRTLATLLVHAGADSIVLLRPQAPAAPPMAPAT